MPATPNAVWSVDFMADALWNGRRFLTFNVLDHFHREALRIEIVTSLSARRIVRALTELIDIRGRAAMLRMDNGPELINGDLEADVPPLSVAGGSRVGRHCKRPRGQLLRVLGGRQSAQ